MRKQQYAQYKWHSGHWRPTKIQDKIWAVTGLENPKAYFKSRVNWMTLSEIGYEIDLNLHEVGTILYKMKCCRDYRHYNYRKRNNEFQAESL